jgi:hypothetical protein
MVTLVLTCISPAPAGINVDPVPVVVALVTVPAEELIGPKL